MMHLLATSIVPSCSFESVGSQMHFLCALIGIPPVRYQPIVSSSESHVAALDTIAIAGSIIIK